MTDEQKREDLRITKTRRAIVFTLFELINKQSFKKITVNRLCNEAQISRATFYSHFEDKYHLLRYALNLLSDDYLSNVLTCEKSESTINRFVESNKTSVRNILKDADVDTLEILRDFVMCILKGKMKIAVDNLHDPRYIAFSNMLTGGIINCLTWQINHRFPVFTSDMNGYIFEILKIVSDWFDSERGKT